VAAGGAARIEWAEGQMPVLRSIAARFASERPLEGVAVAACLHVTAETAVLARSLVAGGASVSLAAANPLTTQDSVAEALSENDGIEVLGRRGESFEEFSAHVASLVAAFPQITLDDGADLLVGLHSPGAPVGDASPASSSAGDRPAAGYLGGTEETTTGLVRVRRLEADGALRVPVLAVNEARCERAFNDRHGTGQSALDGILRATNVLLAGQTLVVVGYGQTGRGIADRARGAGAAVVVCEVDPLAALEARMDGYEVMPALEAAARGDVFVTVTGSRRVLRGEHFERMKDGAILANAGHFDVEIDLDELGALADGLREVRPLVEAYSLGDRTLHLLARGRVVNLAAAEGHPAAVMDVSFAIQALCVEEIVKRAGDLGPAVHPVPAAIDEAVARLKLAALGAQIDALTDDQREYLDSWT
jgi:adenosylhomocysteinase